MFFKQLTCVLSLVLPLLSFQIYKSLIMLFLPTLYDYHTILNWLSDVTLINKTKINIQIQLTN